MSKKITFWNFFSRIQDFFLIDSGSKINKKKIRWKKIVENKNLKQKTVKKKEEQNLSKQLKCGNKIFH